MSDKIKYCFYCDACIEEGLEERDHFPIPKSAGGTNTVDCCFICHSMKDRFNIDNWSPSWVLKVQMDFPKFSRETRIFLAKTIKTLYQQKEAICQKSKHSLPR